jgi:riboflavin kinase / FMN adenylyltransferase
MGAMQNQGKNSRLHARSSISIAFTFPYYIPINIDFLILNIILYELMKIVQLQDAASLPISGSVVSVGNFDGVHTGHSLLLQEVVSRSNAQGLTSVIITFDPHTRAVLMPDVIQPVLSSFEEKAVLMESFGIDYLVRIPFDRAFAALSADEFIENILIRTLKARQWVMGEGHTFGKNHTGNKNFSHSSQGTNHITKVLVKSKVEKNRVISSTEIRGEILNGRVEKAISKLGHPYLIVSRRISGLKTGTQLGYPTLNFAGLSPNKVLPPPGIFAAELEYEKHRWKGALYFGNCPTFEKRETHFEFHAFDFSGKEPAEGENADLWLYSMIRPDSAFSNAVELSEAIKKDVTAIKYFFSQEKEQCR